jgi:hypothetical protein
MNAATRILLPENAIVTTRRGGGEILMAATNILFGKFKDDQEKEQYGWTAALTLKVKDRKETQKAFKIRAGQSVRFETIQIRILKIDTCRNGLFVKAEITAAE